MLTPSSHPLRADPRSDSDLVRSLLAGDATAFETIMRRHNRLMFRSARAIVGDDAEAQDVVQEAYLRAFMNLAAWRSEAALSTWLARIAIHVALSVRRKKKPWIEFGQPDDAADDRLESAMMSSEDHPSDPQAQAARAQMRRLLERSIDRLPPLYRSVFMLRAVEGFSVEETATTLAVTPEVVKTRFLRARALLRDFLGAEVNLPANELYAFAGARCDAVVATVLAALHARGLIRAH